MNGKGDRDRTTDRDAYDRGWERIFGGNVDSTKAEMFSDVGATPASSSGTVAQKAEHLICNQTVAGSIPVSTSIENRPFAAPPIRHGIRRIIE
jgi:hypothetical protein